MNTIATVPEEAIVFPLVRGPVVYFLMLGTECVYVGSTKKLGARMHQHKIEFDSIRYIHVERSLLLETERFWIKELKPRHNSHHMKVADSARLPADLLRMARSTLNQRKKRGEKIKMTEYLDAILRDTISAHYEEEAVKFAEEHKPKRKKNGH